VSFTSYTAEEALHAYFKGELKLSPEHLIHILGNAILELYKRIPDEQQH
jgi:hypothetical protein